MKAEPLQGVSVPISQQPKNRFRSDASPIQACYDLLSSGHSLAEILVALKQLGPAKKAQSELSKLVSAPGDGKISHVAGELAPPPQWQIFQVAEPAEISRGL